MRTYNQAAAGANSAAPGQIICFKQNKVGEEMAKQGELIFALDIGTRSVIGLVGKIADGTLEILAVESEEHSERAVVDGQIEDIEQTAKIAGRVKKRLEEKLDITLHEVHVAAAGRVLKSERTSYEMEVDDGQPLGPKELMALEAAAVQKAYEQLLAELQEGSPTDFCSVGHTVVSYRLDGYVYSTLIGHRGQYAGVDMITTFLPNEVVESLYTTMSMLGLTIASMTLEPIAAMNAVVPKELHLLNVALVDVGAGTSDIAVTDKGSICGYTMATIAGDEVTERIMQEFLVDFSVAERMKFAASAKEPAIGYEDVLGFPDEVGTQELLERIQPTIEELAQQIAHGIQSVNGTSPKAVFMVGGGSRTPGLCALVAQALSIDEKRVAVGGSNYMKRQVRADAKYLSAEYATPVGIAVTAMGTKSSEHLTVSLNGTKLQLLGNSMTVMEALRRGGYQYGQIMGRSGKSIVFEYNGERKIVRGGLHTLAEILVNGKLVGLSTLLQPGDEILFTPAVDGEDAAVLLREVAQPWRTFEVDLFGKKVPAGTTGWVNGVRADPDYPIQQMDKVQVQRMDTVGELLKAAGFEGKESGILVNGKACAGPEQSLQPGDRVSLKEASSLQVSDSAVVRKMQGPRILLNGQERVLPLTEEEGVYQFFNLFNYVDIDPNEPKGEIVLMRNGNPASYLDAIQDGDQIEIHWSQEEGTDWLLRQSNDQ